MNYVLSLLTAVLLILAFPNFDLVWLAPVALAPLLVAIMREHRPGRRFLLGYAAGVVYWFGVCYWIQSVLSYYGGLGPVAGWAVFLLFCLAKAAQMGVFALLAGYVMRTWWSIPAVGALWVAIEISHEFLGFAWLDLGNAGIDMGLPMRLAPLTGVYGLSFVFTMTAAALALAFMRRPRRQLLWVAPLPCLIFLAPLPEAHPAKDRAVLVQPNISESEQWTQQSFDETVRSLSNLTMQAALAKSVQPPALVVWPEVPAPFYYDQDPAFRAAMNNVARFTRSSFLLGVVGRAADGAPLNSAQLIGPSGEPVTRYDKVKLVPFGEFVPWPFGFVNKISSEVGDFQAGDKLVVSPVGSHKIGTFICYESVFPNLVRRFVAGGAEVLFNVSNDGYFGRSAAREQHLNIVRMRAAENRRWILRSTNDGITAAIDPAGRLRAKLPPFRRAAARTGFNFTGAQTSYTRHGDWFPILCAFAAAAAVVSGARSPVYKKRV